MGNKMGFEKDVLEILKVMNANLGITSISSETQKELNTKINRLLSTRSETPSPQVKSIYKLILKDWVQSIDLRDFEEKMRAELYCGDFIGTKVYYLYKI